MKEKQYGAAGLSCDLVRGALRGWQTLAGGTRRIAVRGAKADKPKRYEPTGKIQDCTLACQTFVLRGRRGREAIDFRRGGAPMPSRFGAAIGRLSLMSCARAAAVIRPSLSRRRTLAEEPSRSLPWCLGGTSLVMPAAVQGGRCPGCFGMARG